MSSFQKESKIEDFEEEDFEEDDNYEYDYDEKKIDADFECNNLEEAANYILRIY